MKKRMGVDIIVPVYNALEDVKLCVASIKRNTDLSLDRLILIDDKSPDTNIFPFLKSVEEEGIVVLQNAENQGFSGTINRGMAYSDRDVILLNSDTIVTDRWVDKMVACAYSDPAIGTVTPFSNNATLCSVPNFCQENAVPHGLSIDEYASVIERCSMKAYPRISVAVGFCVMIKREVIERTGKFDKETFERGYGEENDFCWRAEQLGYHHVLCDNTYIYHSGSESFLSEEKKRLNAAHQRILKERYPKQFHANDVYVRDNPHQYLRDNIEVYSQLHNGKKNLLYMLHLDFRSDAAFNIGGTQFHVKDLVENLRKEYNVFVVSRDMNFLRLTAYTADNRISFKFHIGETPAFQCFHSEKLEGILENILKAFSIELIHVHHVLGLSFDVFHLAKKLGIPLVTTLHDFYYICPVEKLLENGKTYCGGCGSDCVKCLNHERGYAQQIAYLKTWREKCLEALSACDRLFTPSQSTKDIYSVLYPQLAEKICVVPHGMDRFQKEIHETVGEKSKELRAAFDEIFTDGSNLNGWFSLETAQDQEYEVYVSVEDTSHKKGRFPAIVTDRPDGCGKNFTVSIPDTYFETGKLKLQLSIVCPETTYCSETITAGGYKKKKKVLKRVAFLGGLNVAKGSQLAYQIIKQSGGQYDWYIIGGIGDPDLLALKNVNRIGWYQRENVGALLHQNQIDLVCILPIWPETFCYTVSEAEVAGVPVLATKIGALAERIEKDQTGWLVEPDAQPKDMLKKIQEILEQQEQWTTVKENCMRFEHLSITGMCRNYSDIYNKLFISAERTEDYNKQDIYLAYAVCSSSAYGMDSGQMVDLIKRIGDLDAQLNGIRESFGFKLLQFWRETNIPAKRLIRKMVWCAYRIYKRLK